MAERKSISVPTLVEGVVEFGGGAALMESRSQISGFIGSPANLERYQALAQAIGKFNVDAIISWGFDLGGA